MSDEGTDRARTTPVIGPELKETLGRIAQRHRSVMDATLDLYQALENPEGAGPCMKCFFKILGKLPDTSSEAGVLKQTVERRVEIVASDVTDQVVRRFAIQLEAEDHDLESFCRRMMDHTAQALQDTTEPLVLTFRYRSDAA
ncbi:MAG: hypothetical protein ACFBZ8_07225 [Opitutales bacterium]